MSKRIAVLSGAGGFEDIYFSFRDIVADYGALLTTPTVTSDSSSHLVISAEDKTFSGVLGGITYTAGEIFSFRATLTRSVEKLANIYITFATLTVGRTVAYEISLKIADEGT